MPEKPDLCWKVDISDKIDYNTICQSGWPLGWVGAWGAVWGDGCTCFTADWVRLCGINSRLKREGLRHQDNKCRTCDINLLCGLYSHGVVSVKGVVTQDATDPGQTGQGNR